MFVSATPVPKSSWVTLSSGGWPGHVSGYAIDSTCSLYAPFDTNIGHWIQVDILGFRAIHGVLLEHRGSVLNWRSAGLEVRIGFLELTNVAKKVHGKLFQKPLLFLEHNTTCLLYTSPSPRD